MIEISKIGNDKVVVTKQVRFGILHIYLSRAEVEEILIYMNSEGI